VEVDPRLVPVVSEVTAALDNVEVVAADALGLDYAAIEATDVVANLPYNIAATVVIDVLQRAPLVRRMTVMTQREVAERLAAAPGGKLYGLTSVLVAFHGIARVAGSVSRRAFFPVPNVDSAIVRIDRRAAPDVDAVLFTRVVRAAFSQRRKMLRNPLATMVGSPEQTIAVMESARIEPTARAEQLGVEDFVRLTRAFAEARP
jgi:16S rRNA (adenine1518-N6/adenine1519-N6)-dimethyltransferase